MDAINGSKKVISYDRADICHKCKGTGHKGSGQHKCSDCAGKGKKSFARGNIAFVVTCESCGGSGKTTGAMCE